MAGTFEMIAEGFSIAFRMNNLVLMLIGVVIGLIAGSIPGLSSTNTTAMLLPVTLMFPMEGALIFIAAVYMASQYGGSITAILINTPGTNGAIATTLDGFPLCRQGKAGVAMGLSLFGSTVGGLVSAMLCMLIMKPISRYALMVGTAELFLLALLGISIIISLSEKAPIKGGLAGAIGLLIAAIPAEPSFGMPRATFGFFELYDGVPLISLMCGFFAFPSMISLVGSDYIATVGDKDVKVGIRSILEGCVEAIKRPFLMLFSAVSGMLIGILPGAGVNVAALLTYTQAKNFSKHPEEFGHGSYEGVLAPETANNAVAPGALVPALTLGVPGSATTAVLLAALTLNGVNPGPRVMTNYGGEVYSVFAAIFLATLAMFVLGLPYTAMASRIATVNLAYLIPGVIAVCVMGCFATRSLLFDVWIFLFFGFLGYFMQKADFQHAPFVLGIVMGALAEKNFSIAIKLSGGSFGIFFASPFAIIIWAIILVSIAYPVVQKQLKKKKTRAV